MAEREEAEVCEDRRRRFCPRLVILCPAGGLRVAMIPVNYKKRVGVSMGSGSTLKAVNIGTRMIGLILGYRIRLWLSRRKHVGASSF